jgi:hypothetical protein
MYCPENAGAVDQDSCRAAVVAGEVVASSRDGAVAVDDGWFTSVKDDAVAETRGRSSPPTLPPPNTKEPRPESAAALAKGFEEEEEEDCEKGFFEPNESVCAS